MSKEWTRPDPMPGLIGSGPNQIKPIPGLDPSAPKPSGTIPKIKTSDLSVPKMKSAPKHAAGFMKSDMASNVMGGLANLTTGINSAVQGYTGTQSAINSGLHSAMQAAGP